MDRIFVTGFRSVPPFAQGLVRDLRVRWALEEAGLAYEVRLIDVDERDAPAYRERQPFGMVPAFEADGHSCFESGGIVLQIAEQSEILMPADQDGRADTITWMFAGLNTVELPIRELTALDLQHGAAEWAGLRRPEVVESVNARLRVLSDRLAGRDYLLGRFTAADILMATVLRLIRHTELVASFPLVHDYLRRCEARPSFLRALQEQMAGYERQADVAA
jgi:glutathione S-transferase